MASNPETTAGQEPDTQGVSPKLVIAALAATSIEWLDFFAFGLAAALVFGEAFFPGFSPVAGVLASFATFGVGFVARPVGGVILVISAIGSAANPLWLRRHC